jgi:hypothetical protein
VVTQEDPPGLNDPSKIMLKLPALTPGFYSLTLKTLYSTTGIPLKAPRYITFKTFRAKHLRDATHEEFQQIGKEVEKAYNRERLGKHKSCTRKLVAAV